MASRRSRLELTVFDRIAGLEPSAKRFSHTTTGLAKSVLRTSISIRGPRSQQSSAFNAVFRRLKKPLVLHIALFCPSNLIVLTGSLS